MRLYKGVNIRIWLLQRLSKTYTKKGFPLGSNAGIADVISRVFGFSFEVVLFKTYDYFDEKTRSWMGITGEVNIWWKGLRLVVFKPRSRFEESEDTWNSVSCDSVFRLWTWDRIVQFFWVITKLTQKTKLFGLGLRNRKRNLVSHNSVFGLGTRTEPKTNRDWTETEPRSRSLVFWRNTFGSTYLQTLNLMHFLKPVFSSSRTTFRDH